MRSVHLSSSLIALSAMTFGVGCSGSKPTSSSQPETAEIAVANAREIREGIWMLSATGELFENRRLGSVFESTHPAVEVAFISEPSMLIVTSDDAARHLQISVDELYMGKEDGIGFGVLRNVVLIGTRPRNSNPS